jgi:hypothetical protein
LPVTRSSGTVAVAPLDQVTVIEAGAATSCMSVITKCHSVESHSWSSSALAWMTVVPPPVVVDVEVVPVVPVDVEVPVPPDVEVEVDVLVPPEVLVEDELVPDVFVLQLLWPPLTPAISRPWAL